MSVRHRAIAGAPERAADEAATVLLEIVKQTLAPASALVPAETERELDQARDAVRILIAGKHLKDSPIVLAADPLRLELTVITGDSALTLKETLGKVPGAATATEWSLHIPAPAPVAGWIEDAVKSLDHVTSEPAATQAATASKGQFATSRIDADALRRVAGGGT